MLRERIVVTGGVKNREHASGRPALPEAASQVNWAGGLPGVGRRKNYGARFEGRSSERLTWPGMHCTEAIFVR
jgi:hypothetical protein